jgi:predicted membrane protein
MEAEVVRMGFIFSEVFWGVLLIIIGASVVIKAIFHVSIPIFPLIVAFILIYGGIRILMGNFGLTNPPNTVLFNDATIEVTNPAATYNVLFGRGVIDLTKIDFTKETLKVNINTIFGGGVVRLNPETPVRIVANSAFAEAKLPDGNRIQFGNVVYQSKNYQATGQNSLLIEVNVVFGGLEIVNQ